MVVTSKRYPAALQRSSPLGSGRLISFSTEPGHRPIDESFATGKAMIVNGEAVSA